MICHVYGRLYFFHTAYRTCQSAKIRDNHADSYDVGLVQGDDLVANDHEENNDATSLVPCVLSSSKPTSIVYHCDSVHVINSFPGIRIPTTEFRGK